MQKESNNAASQVQSITGLSFLHNVHHKQALLHFIDIDELINIVFMFWACDHAHYSTSLIRFPVCW